jgi:hypothetical protein
MDDSAIFATHEDPMIASLNLQQHISSIEIGFRIEKPR